MTTGRQRRQPSLELRREGPTGNSRPINACAERRQRNFLATLLLLRACRCCSPATSRHAPARQQQRLLLRTNDISWIAMAG